MRIKWAISATLLCTGCAASFANQASWYEWRNKMSGSLYCGLKTPGDIWVQYSGPYRDDRCTLPAEPTK